MRKLVLAPNSVDLHNILDKLNISYEIDPYDQPIDLPSNLYGEELVEYLAYKKAKKISEEYPESIAGVSECLVYLETNRLEIPKEKDRLQNFLINLSEKNCTIFSGYCLIDNLSQGIITKTFNHNIKIKLLSYQKVNQHLEKYSNIKVDSQKLTFWLDISTLNNDQKENLEIQNSIDDHFRKTLPELKLPSNTNSNDIVSLDLKREQNLIFQNGDQDNKQSDLLKEKSIFENIHINYPQTNVNRVASNITDQDGTENQISRNENYHQTSEDNFSSFVYSENKDEKSYESEYGNDGSDFSADSQNLLDRLRGNKRFSEVEQERDARFQKFKKYSEFTNNYKSKNKLKKRKNLKKSSSLRKKGGKKKKDNYKREAESGYNIFLFIFSLIHWFLGQDVIARFIIAMIAGILAFGFIFSSMGLISGY